jgi:hypothetical protein
MGIKEKLKVEKDAKNRAYAFIIATGLLPQFQKFVNETHDIDPHELSLKLFAIM